MAYRGVHPSHSPVWTGISSSDQTRGHTLIELAVAVALLGVCTVAGIISLASGVGAQEARGAAQSWQAAAAWAQVGVLWHGGSVALDYEDGNLDIGPRLLALRGEPRPLSAGRDRERECGAVGGWGRRRGYLRRGAGLARRRRDLSTSKPSGPAIAWLSVRQAGSRLEVSRCVEAMSRPRERAAQAPDPLAVVGRVDPARGHGSRPSHGHLVGSACRSGDVRRRSGRPRTRAGESPG